MTHMQAVLLIIAANLALYLKTLRHKFVSDDFTVCQTPPPFNNAWHKAWLRFIGACKLWSKSVHFINKDKKWYVAIVKDEQFEHFIALAIHIVLCVSIYFAFGSSWEAFLAAMLYGTNPANNQGTIWPGGRGYVLPALSIMLAMAIPILSPIFLYFCVWFTAGFLTPLALIGSSKWWLLAFMPAIWLIHSFKFSKAIKLKQKYETFDADKEISVGRFVMAVKTYGFYLVFCLVPFRVTFYHNFLQSAAGSGKDKAYTVWDKYFWFGVSGFALCVWLCLTHWGPLAWSFLAFTITIQQFSNWVRANQEIAERFVTVPNLFLMFFLAQIVAPYPVAIGVVLAFYVTRTFYTVDLYKDEYWITERAVVEDRHAWWAWHCRAMKRWDTQSYKEALLLWVMARLISPNEFKILINISTCLRIIGNHKEADEFLGLAEKNIVAGQEATAKEIINDCRKGKAHIVL